MTDRTHHGGRKQRPLSQGQSQGQGTPRTTSPPAVNQQKISADNAKKKYSSQSQQDQTYASNKNQTKPPQYQNQSPQYQPQPQPQQVVVIVPAGSVYGNRPTSSPTQEDPAWAGSSFSNKQIRHAFIRKVYLILTAMLIVTGIFVCVFLFVQPVKRWVHRNGWFLWISFGIYFIAYLALACCRTVRRHFPTNFICLMIFNFAFSYVCAAISSYFSTEIILIAVAITIAVCLAVTIFAIQTKIDFTMCTGLLFILSMVLVMFGLACLIVYLIVGPIYILRCVYGAVAALVFGLFLAYDTQMIIGGRKYQLSPEEYISGALELYMDVGTIYLIILSFFNIGG